MPKRINNTTAPRNHIARALAQRGGGGAHQSSRSGQRQQSRAALQGKLDDWREELEFERELLDESTDNSSINNNSINTNLKGNNDGSGNEPSANLASHHHP